jgi:hypothetical protein
VVIVAAAVIAVLVVTYFAVHKIKPATFKLSASILKLFTLTLEIRSPRRSKDDP